MLARLAEDSQSRLLTIQGFTVYLLVKCKAIWTCLCPVRRGHSKLHCGHCRFIKYDWPMAVVGPSNLNHCIQPGKQHWPCWVRRRVILPVGAWHFWQESPLLTVGVGAMADFPDSGRECWSWVQLVTLFVDFDYLHQEALFLGQKIRRRQ